MFDVVAGQRRHAAGAHRRARIGARLVFQGELGGDEAAVAHRAQAYLDHRPRGGSAGLEGLGARHHHPHRPSALLRQRQRDRLEIDGGLATEAATDLGRRHPQVAQRNAQQAGTHRPHRELALGGHPDLVLAIGPGAGHAGVRLEVALVNRRGDITPLDHHIGLGEASRRIAATQLDLLGDVRGRRRARHLPLGEEIVVQQRRIGRHRRLHVDDVRQHLVLDADQRERLAQDIGRGRRHRRHRVTDIQDLVTRHAVFRERAQRGRALAGFHFLVAGLGEIGSGHHRLDAGQRARGGGVDAKEAGMGMGASLDAAGEHAGQSQVGAEVGATGDLVRTVGADRALADDLERRGRDGIGHRPAPCSRSWAAAACTARTTLS